MSDDPQPETNGEDRVDLPAGGVLAAVDGSPSAYWALEWAAKEAKMRQLPLIIAHVYHWPSSGLSAMDAIGFLMEELAADSQRILDTAASDAKEYAPEIEVHTVSELGPPVPTLLDLAVGRDLLVVGSRGLGGFKGLLLGSTSKALVTHAPCPVLVVRPPGE